MYAEGSVIVKYDMEVCGEFDSLGEAIHGIRCHHWVREDPREAGQFEFFVVMGRACGKLSSTKDRPHVYDEDGDRVINGSKVIRLGYILNEEHKRLSTD